MKAVWVLGSTTRALAGAGLLALVSWLAAHGETDEIPAKGGTKHQSTESTLVGRFAVTGSSIDVPILVDVQVNQRKGTKPLSNAKSTPVGFAGVSVASVVVASGRGARARLRGILVLSVRSTNTAE